MSADPLRDILTGDNIRRVLERVLAEQMGNAMASRSGLNIVPADALERSNHVLRQDHFKVVKGRDWLLRSCWWWECFDVDGNKIAVSVGHHARLNDCLASLRRVASALAHSAPVYVMYPDK